MEAVNLQSSSSNLECYVLPELRDAHPDGWFNAPASGDAGFDLRSSRELLVSPGMTVKIPTGIHLAIPEGFVGLVKDRSSMAAQCLRTSGGVIDASYRGEVLVLLSNMGILPYKISVGDRVAQLVVLPCLTSATSVDTLESLGQTERGDGGFGSTGK